MGFSVSGHGVMEVVAREFGSSCLARNVNRETGSGGNYNPTQNTHNELPY